MRHTYRCMSANVSSGFTRECSIVATRIDRRFFSRATGRMVDLLHIIKANATFIIQIVNHADHRAVDATFQVGSPTRREKESPPKKKETNLSLRTYERSCARSHNQQLPPK